MHVVPSRDMLVSLRGHGEELNPPNCPKVVKEQVHRLNFLWPEAICLGPFFESKIPPKKFIWVPLLHELPRNEAAGLGWRARMFVLENFMCFFCPLRRESAKGVSGLSTCENSETQSFTLAQTCCVRKFRDIVFHTGANLLRTDARESLSSPSLECQMTFRALTTLGTLRPPFRRRESGRLVRNHFERVASQQKAWLLEFRPRFAASC